MSNHEGLIKPDIIPVTEIADDQIATIVRTRRYETEPFVLHRPDTIDEQDTDAIAQLTTNRLTTIKEADPYLSTDFEPYMFAPSKYVTRRAETDVGLHYDRLEALVAHVTLAGSCTASFLADNGAPYKGPRTLSISTIERPYRIEQA